MTQNKTRSFSFDDVFVTRDDAESYLGRNFSSVKRNVVMTETPPFPRKVLIEITNICNHKCLFCNQPDMKRQKSSVTMETFRRIVGECYELGAREISLGGGSEPLYNRELDKLISFCKETGYEYIYTTTNGSIAGHDRWKRIIDAGIDSIKVSINGGDRETYKKVHGQDHFDRVIDSVRFINSYRKTLDRDLFLGVSFVEHPENKGTFENLEKVLGGDVDELVCSRALRNPTDFSQDDVGVDGAIGVLHRTGDLKCYQPFSQVTFSVEGYLRACCIEWDNIMAAEDLASMSIEKAWCGPHMRDLRNRFIAECNSTGNLKGTLCQRCVYGDNSTFEVLNPDLQ